MGSFSTVNPVNGEKINSFNYLAWKDAEDLITAAHQDFQIWRKFTILERSQILVHLALKLRMNKYKLAGLMQLEMGKVLAEGLAEVEKCATTCEYYAENSASILAPQNAESGYSQTQVIFQPLGVIFSIMPWNFPLWQVIRFAAPALMAGNTVLLKHADITAGTAQLLGEIFEELNTNLKILRNCHVSHSVAELIIAHPFIRGVTFTGSSEAGRQVAVEAARSLKKIVLELGGSDPYLILEDADLDLAARSCAKTRLQNCGQSCVAGKRFIVVESIAPIFIQRFQQEMKAAELPPLAAKRFQKIIGEQVEKLKRYGGKVLVGGNTPEGPGAFYPATLIVFNKNHPEINNEEIFGPVAVIIVVKDLKEALEVANSSQYGLGAGIFTQNKIQGKKIAETDLDAGFVVVNDIVKSDPRIPFGGIKNSGYGRELGHFGIMEFVNIKTVGLGS